MAIPFTLKVSKSDAIRSELPLIAQVHEHGHLALDDFMGNDLTIVNNARVSFDQQSEEFGPNEVGLVGYLLRNKHGSPFEAVTFRFDVKLPIFVARQWHRHRAGHSYNEWSARYSEIAEEFFVPEPEAVREQKGKPGAYTFVPFEDADRIAEVRARLAVSQELAGEAYKELLSLGVAKEQARTVLPMGTYTRMKWTCNLRSLMHFCALRNSEHAQAEIRAYAALVENFAAMVCPVAMKSFVDNGRIAP